MGLTLAAFAAAVLLHALVRRLPLALDGVTSFLLTGTAVGVALVAAAILEPGPRGAATVLAYAGLCELYIFLFTLVSSSVSAGILLALREGAATIDELAPPAEMVETRIATMTRTGLLAGDAGRPSVTPRGRALLATFARLRTFFRHPAPGVRPLQPPAASPTLGRR